MIIRGNFPDFRFERACAVTALLLCLSMIYAGGRQERRYKADLSDLTDRVVRLEKKVAGMETELLLANSAVGELRKVDDRMWQRVQANETSSRLQVEAEAKKRDEQDCMLADSIGKVVGLVGRIMGQ